ncbi:MAG TPA: L,D-transpeptidase family protein [Ilumatobacteraceae bacterium]|nr:L,D-transpeptidase family protein [Ilumatobacteraceae bacterium]
MSRSYRTLALALVGMLVLVGLAKLVGRDTQAAGSSEPVSAESVSGTTVGDADVSETLAATDATDIVTDVVDGDQSTTSAATPPITAACTITTVLKTGATGDEVQCLESQLFTAGYATTVDTTFDAATDAAVKAYQTAKSLEVDGIVGRKTAQAMGIWAGPLGPMPATDDDCPDTPHGAIVDRANQRGALCADGAITYEFPITTAISQPDPGTYPVYAKDLNASSTLTGQYSTMTHFVAFTRGKYQGARIAFHSIPTYTNGKYIQPLDSVGTPAMHGESSGCIRVLPDDSVKIWDWLGIEDEVHVIS